MRERKRESSKLSLARGWQHWNGSRISELRRRGAPVAPQEFEKENSSSTTP
ncbi:hypothetical protein CDL15_Pgr029167 [Punica granatum]|uniref:Uncharacterized protein n=1 Tax=Punica granatum TaxID=22663 RepID=A0A218XDM4_PUNGR|nr:hypothetical protein CDL15_Pgr029167 [Punica granatum]